MKISGLKRYQPAIVFKGIEHLADAEAGSGVNDGRCDIRQGAQNEGALGQPGMGHGEVGQVDDLAAEEDDIEIDRPGPVALAGLRPSLSSMPFRKASSDGPSSSVSAASAMFRKRGWSVTYFGSDS